MWYSQPRLLYIRYKKEGNEMLEIFDPEERLKCCKSYEKAITVIPTLINKLPKEAQDRIYEKTKNAIALRKEIAIYYTNADSKANENHQKYIDFLQEISNQLDAIKEQALPADKRQQVVDVKEQRSEEEPKQSEEMLRGSKDDDPNALTLAQTDFLAFLEAIMSIARDAAGLWKEVAQGKLPIWVASTLSSILLREVKAFVNVTCMLDQENQSKGQKIVSKSPTPWVPDAVKPQLTQDWVNALDNAGDKGRTWLELTKTPRSFWPLLELIMRPYLNQELSSTYAPYIFTMLIPLNGSYNPTSVAELPLETLVAVYFCELVMGHIDPEFLTTARSQACVTMEENLVILPRLVEDTSVTDEDAQEYHDLTAKMMAWTLVCKDPISLGWIQSYAQLTWVDWHVRLIASNSAPLQVFMYLCEKRRLQVTDVMGNGDDDGYERLLGRLMEDPRVAPVMLMDGRPKTVAQCVQALRKWCLMETKDGETLELHGNLGKLTLDRGKLMEHSTQKRSTSLLGRDIQVTNYGITKDIRDRLCSREGQDEDALRRYLIWEASAPNCLKLEAILIELLCKLPEWGDALAMSILQRLCKSDSRWRQSIENNIRSGIKVVLAKKSPSTEINSFEVTDSFFIAIIKSALRMSGHEEWLKVAFIKAFKPPLNPLAIEVYEHTKEKLNVLEVERLSAEPKVVAWACILCLLPLRDASWTKDDCRPRNKVIGDLLESFLDVAKPVFDNAYNNSPVDVGTRHAT